MGSSSNNKKSNSRNQSSRSTVSKEVRSYAKDPTFEKRADASKEFLDRVGFPKELVRLWKERQSKLNKNTSE